LLQIKTQSCQHQIDTIESPIGPSAWSLVSKYR